MSLSFRVRSRALPGFHEVVREAALAEPIQLVGAGWTADPWPRALLARVADAASTAHEVELSPDVASHYERAGLVGCFLAFAHGSARGVPVERGDDAVTFHVPVFATPVDYDLAVALAAATARLARSDVLVEDPAAVDRPSEAMAPGVLLERWSDAAAAAHAVRVGSWLAEDIAQGRSYFFYGPRGFVEVGPSVLDGVEASERLVRVQDILAEHLRGGAAIDRRRTAVLLTAAMVFAAGADGVLADEEARQLEAHFATVPELGGYPPRELLDAVRSDVPGIPALGELPTPLLRRKAFVLAAEIIASARGGRLDGDPLDPNVRAVTALARALSLEDDQLFVAQVVRTVMAKYEDGAADDDVASALALAMVMTASADGHIDEREAAVLSALARTVPELRTREVGPLFEAAKARTQHGAEAALASLAALPRCKSKCFALATEVALVAGNGPRGTLLPRLRETLCPDRDDADSAIATFAAKYAKT